MKISLGDNATRRLYTGIQQLPPGGVMDRLLFSTLRTLGSVHPLRSRMQHIGGRIHFIRGDYQAAQQWCQDALAAGRGSQAATHNMLGRSQAVLGNFQQAETHLKAAIAAVPGNDGYYLNLAEALRRQGKHEEEEVFLRQALEIKPGSAWTHFCLFQNAKARYGIERALDEWLDRVLATPDMEDPIIHPDWWLVHQSAYSELREQKARAVLAQHPEAHDCQLLLAYLLRYSEQPAAGVPHLRTASRQRWEALHGAGSAADFHVAKPPAFLVMGVAKSGSSALYQYLCMHPLICRAMAKEINFWSDHYAAGRDWYQACFPPIPVASPVISGEASIKTFWFPEAPRRIAEDFPGLKLILILREPVARAFSDYNMTVRLGREQRSWEQCVQEQLAEHPVCPVRENEMPPGFTPEHQYLLKGAALPVLKRWLRYHDKSKLLVLHNRDLDTDTTATMNRVFRFLELPEHAIVAPPRMNVGGYKPLTGEIRARLERWYQPHQEALHEFLAREFP